MKMSVENRREERKKDNKSAEGNDERRVGYLILKNSLVLF